MVETETLSVYATETVFVYETDTVTVVIQATGHVVIENAAIEEDVGIEDVVAVTAPRQLQAELTALATALQLLRADGMVNPEAPR